LKGPETRIKTIAAVYNQMSLLGQRRPSNSAPAPPFVRCCSNRRQNGASRRTQSCV